MNDLIFLCLCNNGKDYDKLTKMQQIEVQMFVLILSIINEQFKWEGLPPELKPYNLEKVLNMYGQGVLFKVEGTDQYAFCSAVNSAKLNIYGEPCEVQPIAINGVSFPRVYVNTTLGEGGEIKSKNAVLIKNNIYSVPTYFLVKPFIDHLCFIWESKGINAGLSRIKAIIHANKSLAGILKQEIKKVIGSKSMIPVVSEKIDVMKQIEKLDFNVEYQPDIYWEDFDKTIAFICQMLGITTNMSQAKKERLIVSEVESNDELTTIAEDTRLSYRKMACEEVKELFNMSWSCENKVPDTKATSPMDNEDHEPEEPTEE